MNILIDMLAPKPVLLDGAWGSQLMAHGLPVGECPDAWNITNAAKVQHVAGSYVGAGSRIILTNTFGANRLLLARYGLKDSAADINRRGAAISCKAASGHALVFGSVGPTGKMLAAGEISDAELLSVFTEQTQALSAGGVYGIVIETMSDIDEARIAVKAAKLTGLPVVACMVFGYGKNGDRTMNGVTPETAAIGLADAGADAVGSNCGCGPAVMVSICERMKSAVSLAVWMKPNAGLPQQVGDRAVFVYNTTPETFAKEAMGLVRAGADYLGGCCGTSPAFVAALQNELSQYVSNVSV